MNLSDAQDNFRSKLHALESVDCDVCGRSAEVYAYSLSYMLAKLLVATYEQFKQQPVPFKKLPDIVTEKAPNGKFVTNYSALKHFGCFEQLGKGNWRVPDFGVQVINGERLVEQDILVCFDKVVGRSAEQMSLQDIIAHGQDRRRVVKAKIDASVSLPTLTDAQILMTVEEAIQHHSASLLDGGLNCVLCGRHNQVYPRPLNSEMGRILVRLYELGKVDGWDKYFHVYNDIGTRGGEYGQMKFHELIESDKSREGFWRTSLKGRELCERKIEVPAKFITLNDRLIGFAGQMVTIDDILKTHFDKSELLAA